ncbi:hypothetical protein R3W88_017772 [Solanum pinnatisectum]|uniref:DUF674 domain-containing protein n=1 Tax=Solanum pinnatisectum TaxID=50273 RepID=A0AAV9L3R4_9SOLN|nr:hypothetical protein R3W88_017772 [Solanum pinnatisectum]
MTGSLPNLYNSVENMNDAYIQSKNILLKPNKSSHNPFLLLDNVPSLEKIFYGCNNNNVYNAYSSMGTLDAICPCCRKGMSKKMNYIVSEGGGKGAVAAKSRFVKEAVTYMVMDDLVVKPMSTISSITLLNKFKVKDGGVLQENVVYFGMKEMLKASFESKTVLTSVFMTGAKRRRTE